MRDPIPSSVDVNSLDALSRSILTHTHVPSVGRPASTSEASTCGNSTDIGIPSPENLVASTISTDLVGQLSTLEGPGIRTIDTNYDASNEGNGFRYRGKTMEERHAPTEKLRTAAGRASHSRSFDAFDKKVRESFIRDDTGLTFY